MSEPREPQDEDEQLLFTVASVWRDERVSCPHPDLLRAWAAGDLDGGAREFIDFHMREAQCPYCNATVEEQQAADRECMSMLCGSRENRKKSRNRLSYWILSRQKSYSLWP